MNRRPYITSCRRIVGTAILAATGAKAELLQRGLDEETHATCYVIRADGSWPFAVWPDELADVAWAMPLPA